MGQAFPRSALSLQLARILATRERIELPLKDLEALVLPLHQRAILVRMVGFNTYNLLPEVSVLIGTTSSKEKSETTNTPSHRIQMVRAKAELHGGHGCVSRKL